MVARPPTHQEACPSLDALEVTRRGCESRDSAGGGSDGAQSEGAGTALTSALVREICEDPRGLDDAAPS